MTMMLKSLPLIGLALALSACGTSNRGMESVHQPVVQRSDYVIDVNAAGDRLAPGERERLDGWFNSIGVSYGDRVAIDDPTGAQQGQRDVADLLSRRGMMIAGAAPVTAGALPPGSVRVVVSRASAGVPGCPDWSRPATPEFTGSTMSNYGCAVNGALAAMVADPHDLVHGRDSSGPADPTLSAKAIKTFREAPPSGNRGLKVESTSKVGS
jgi:pilus assembly protein CpaD